MNCVLQGLPRPSTRLGAAKPVAFGVDYGWGNITPARAKAMRLAFVASYLSPDVSKNFTAAEVEAFHAAGIKTVDVWESTATRATGGFAAGVADARAAKAQAAALGNTFRPVLFAVDCDCAGTQITGYFRGARSVLGSRVDAYGGYRQVAFLVSHHLVGSENWQTYAWSGGRWLPASVAPLEQYLNGSTFDDDRAIRVPYGEFPWTAPKAPTRPVVTRTTTPPATSTNPPTGPHKRPRRVLCWGPRSHPYQSACMAVFLRHSYLIDRRDKAHTNFIRCIRFADGIGCSKNESRWYTYRRQAHQFWGKHFG